MKKRLISLLLLSTLFINSVFAQRGAPIRSDKEDLGQFAGKVFHDLFPNTNPVKLFHLPDLMRSVNSYFDFCKIKIMEMYGAKSIDELPEYVQVAIGDREVDDDLDFSLNPEVITHMSVKSMFKNKLIKDLDVNWANMSGYYYENEHYLAYPILLWIQLSQLLFIWFEPWTYILEWLDGDGYFKDIIIQPFWSWISIIHGQYLVIRGPFMMFFNVLVISSLDVLWVVLQFLYWLLIQTFFQQFMYIISGVCMILRQQVNVYMYVTYYNDYFIEKVRGNFWLYFGRAVLFPFLPFYWWFMFMFENQEERFYRYESVLDAWQNQEKNPDFHN